MFFGLSQGAAWRGHVKLRTSGGIEPAFFFDQDMQIKRLCISVFFIHVSSRFSFILH